MACPQGIRSLADLCLCKPHDQQLVLMLQVTHPLVIKHRLMLKNVLLRRHKLLLYLQKSFNLALVLCQIFDLLFHLLVLDSQLGVVLEVLVDEVEALGIDVLLGVSGVHAGLLKIRDVLPSWHINRQVIQMTY